MDVNKRYFLDFLLGTGDVHVLFEPYFSRENAEALIWRRGDHLWDSPKEYIKTMLSVAERTQSDVMVCDIGLFGGNNKLLFIEYLRKYMLKGRPVGTCVICHSQDDVDMTSDIADCLFTGIKLFHSVLVSFFTCLCKRFHKFSLIITKKFKICNVFIQI